MNKKDIIEIVNKKTKHEVRHISIIVECLLNVFMKTLAQERRIEIRDFGVFEVRRTPPRVGRNPITGEEASVPARNVVHFKAGKRMRRVVEETVCND